MRLPERQREALALRELEELSYGEIATIMEVNRNTVAQLISRARINLRDELRGTVLASVAPSQECERALPLIAMREDEQLDAATSDAAWLDAHLADCDRCRLAVEAMRDAGASYRAWAVAAPPWLLKETTTKAAELGGHSRGKRPRRRVMLVAGLMALLLFVGLAAALSGDDQPATPAGPAAGAARGPSIGAAKPAKANDAHKTKGGAEKKTETSTTASPIPTSERVPTGGGAPSEPASSNGSSGKTAVQKTPQTPAPEPSSKAKSAPTSTPAPPPATATTPATEETSPAKEPPKGPPQKHDPPDKK
jgi:sigma-70-like protein